MLKKIKVLFLIVIIANVFSFIGCQQEPKLMSAEITSVDIPNANITYAGKTLPVTIRGKNFIEFSAETYSNLYKKFSGIGAGITNFRVLNDTMAIAEVICPDSVGIKEVTVKCEQSIYTTTFKVLKVEQCYEIGDIILSDGSNVNVDEIENYSFDEKNKPIGIVVSAIGGVDAKIMGLKNSYLEWGKGTVGINTNFTEIQTESGYYSDYNYYDYVFTGDLEGSDNWEYICSVDPEETKNSATNYPAFNFSLTYAETAGLIGTDYAEGWYVPSIAELYDVYKNKSIIQNSLAKIEGFSLGANFYWSSSQYPSNNSSAFGLKFSSSSLPISIPKNYKNNVLVLKKISAEQVSVQVTNLNAIYSRKTNKIVLSWENLENEDFIKTIISYKKTGSDDVSIIEVEKNQTSVEIENIIDDDSEYIFSFRTKDKEGSLSKTKKIAVIAAIKPFISNISLDRTHLDTIMTNRDIVVTVKGSNFDLLTNLLVQVTDGTFAYPPVSAVIDAENNVAAAIVTAPTPTNATDEGVTYTVKAIVDSTTPAEETSSFVVSNPSDVTAITLEESQIKVGTVKKVTATIIGTNFDIRGITKVKLFDTKGTEITTSTALVENNGSATEITLEILVPIEEGFYTIAVYFDDVKDNTTARLQVYGVPTITSVTIPTAGISYAGNTLPVTIRGKNFTAPDINVNSFTGIGASITNFIVLDDSMVTAEVTCPYLVGTTQITVNCVGATKTATLKVVDIEKYYKVGDILLIDGTKVSVDEVETFEINEKNKPIGVIASVSYGGGVGKLLGLQHSSRYLKWAPNDTTGYNTEFTEIQTKYSGSNSIGYTFTGNLEGSNNWEYICNIDPEGTKDAAINYPVFNFALTYAETAELINTNYAEGWYVPSIAELYDIYINRKTVQTSLSRTGSFILDSNYYWSSSQASSKNFVYGLNFQYDYIYNDYKNTPYYRVLVIQAVNIQ